MGWEPDSGPGQKQQVLLTTAKIKSQFPKFLCGWHLKVMAKGRGRLGLDKVIRGGLLALKRFEQTPVCCVLSVHPLPQYDIARKPSLESGLGLHRFKKQGLNELFFTSKPALGISLQLQKPD